MKVLSLVLVLFGLAAVASAYQARKDPCAWGPTYWCKSRANAQQCRQVNYCRENFWREPSVKMSAPKDDACNLCKVLVGLVDSELKDNSTEEEVKDFVEQFCSYLGDLKDECQQMVDTYFIVIWNLLVQELSDPTEVCTRLGLCTNSTIAVGGTAALKTFASSPTTSLGGSGCATCTKVVDEISKVVNNSLTEEAAKELAKKACDLLGTLAPECKLLIDGFFGEIWELLDKELTPQEICRQIKLCSSKSAVKAFVASQKASFGLECSICKSLIGEVVKKLVNTSSAQNKIESMVEEVCTALPNGTDQDECKTFIKTFFPTIWKLFIDDLMTPDKVCNLLGICGNKSVSLRRSPFVFSRVSAKARDYPYCDVCKEADEALKAFLDGANQTQIKQELEAVCTMLPDEISSQCTDLVDNYFDLVWTILKGYVDNPEQFCELLNLCNSTAKSVFTKPVLSGAECEVCKTLVHFGTLFLSRNSTEEEVLGVLEKVCAILPSEISGECTEFVNQYGRSLYSLLMQELDPDTICTALRACTSSVLNSGAVCETCEEGLKLVKSLLPETTGTVVSLLTELCGLMPSALQDECTTFVKQYGPDLIPLIAGLIDPDKDCQMIGLCSQAGVFNMRRSF